MKAFLRKEWLEMTRTGRLLIIGILFFLFGVMNPAIAKLTPALLEMMKDAVEQSGITVGEVKVDAMASWTQFYKNASIVLIVIVLMLAGVLVNEYQKGTLVQVVTKGLSRRKIMLVKMITVYGTWTAAYLVYFGVTFGYNAYFWGDEKVEHLFPGVFSLWLMGMLLLALVLLFSAFASSMGQVLMGVGLVTVVLFFLNYIPKLSKYLPFRLMDGIELMGGRLEIKDFIPAIVAACISTVLCSIISLVAFDKRNL